MAAKLVWLFAASRWGAAEAARHAAEISLLKNLAATAPGVWCRWSTGREQARVTADFAARLGLAAGSGFDDLMAGLADQDAAHLAAALEALRAGTGNDSFTMTVETADGTSSFEAVGGFPGDHGGVVLWLRDVSGAAAMAERDRLLTIIDTLPLPVWRRHADDLFGCHRQQQCGAGAVRAR